ncbi:cytochrome C biogenesis protein [Halorussus salilacus]|uniref:cytochrome c biogenesis protein CcdA n=1 Tax=Halorussus salilacus TaxID=2953750 RepID=UPI00209EBBD4|nr:cytochrome c biogenesis protein CcdA [Halorussus salilacus]USZ68989.1 cytochrome C biogenesis protein [Halorussus salilacus]
MTASGFVGALAFAASTGVATFFAPCAFPLLPGYVGYYVTGADRTTGVTAAAAAATGALVALGAVAGLVFALGRTVTSILPLFEPLVGVGLVAFGVLVLTGRAPDVRVALPERPESLLGFGAFGAVYAVAAAGCVAPLFLGVVTQALAFPPGRGAAVLGVYAGAVSAPLVGVTLLANAGVYVWRGLGRHAGRLEQAAAVVMILAGLGQLYLSVVVLDVV